MVWKIPRFYNPPFLKLTWQWLENPPWMKMYLERLLCPIFLGNLGPRKPATIALKIGHQRLSRYIFIEV